jgi:hypothetical protein
MVAQHGGQGAEWPGRLEGAASPVMAAVMAAGVRVRACSTLPSARGRSYGPSLGLAHFLLASNRRLRVTIPRVNEQRFSSLLI